MHKSEIRFLGSHGEAKAEVFPQYYPEPMSSQFDSTTPYSVTQAAVTHVQSSEFYDGATPHPEIVDRYNQINPGMGNRLMETIMAIADRQSRVQEKIADAAIAESEGNSERASRGQWIAGGIVAFGMVISLAVLFVTENGYATAACMGAVLVGSFVAAMMGRRVPEKSETKIEKPTKKP